MSTEQVSLPELFERFLKASIDELDLKTEGGEHALTMTDVLIDTRHRIAARLDDALPGEVGEGLQVLWRMTRHIAREECWRYLRDEYMASGEIRPDILEWRKEQEDREAAFVSSHMSTPTRHDTEIRWQDEQKAWERKKAAVSEFMRQHFSDTNPILQNLGIVEEDGYWMEHWCHYWIGDWDTEVLRSLVALAPRFQACLGNDPLFWAVFGPIADAIASEPGGFEDEIGGGISWMLATRIRSGQADLFDYWLSLEREEDEDQHLAVTKLIEYVDHASSAECEDFFRAFDLDYVGEPAAESRWPDAEVLWAKILRKRDLSVQLLGRAGRYYWSSSAKRYGPSEALAACGMDSMFCLRYGIYPFLPFWSAARAAADEGRWQFSADCLSAALVDIALRAPFLEGDGLRLVEDERFDVRFVPELCIRFKDEIDSGRYPIRECLLLALESVRESQLGAMTDLPRALEDIGRKVEIQKLQAGEVVLKTIGADVRAQIAPETWDKLLAAELAWLSQDYTAVGVHYRRALENEWRRKVGSMLTRFAAKSLDRMTPGEMMRVLLDTLRGDTIGRAVVTQQMGPTNPLLRGHVLEAAIEVCDTFLNEAAHARGLDRRQCEDLRGRLLADALLKKCLQGVQAVGPASR